MANKFWLFPNSFLLISKFGWVTFSTTTSRSVSNVNFAPNYCAPTNPVKPTPQPTRSSIIELSFHKLAKDQGPGVLSRGIYFSLFQFVDDIGGGLLTMTKTSASNTPIFQRAPPGQVSWCLLLVSGMRFQHTTHTHTHRSSIVPSRQQYRYISIVRVHSSILLPTG